MSQIPENLKYSESHEWILVNNDTATLGITDHAQAELSDIVFVDLPTVGEKTSLGDTVAVLESVKAASDIYTPISGEVIESNEALNDNPALVNSDPYGKGWICKIKLSNPAEVDALMDASAYANSCQ